MRSGLPGCGGVAQSEAERRPTEVPCRCTRIQRQCITTTCAAALTWRRQGQLRSTQGLSTESVVCRLLLLVLVCARLGHRAAKRSAIPDKCSPGGWECGVDLSTATPALCAWSMPRLSRPLVTALHTDTSRAAVKPVARPSHSVPRTLTSAGYPGRPATHELPV